MERSGPRGASPEALSARALERLEARDTGRANVLRTLLYEEVRDGAALERHLEHFDTRHPVVSIGRVLDTFEGGHALPPRALLLAFRNPASFAARVWPVLRRRGCAAVLFVAPRLLAGPAPGEPARAEPLLGGVRGDGAVRGDADVRRDIEELRRLAGEGVALGLSEEPAPEDPGRAGWRRALETLEEIAPGAARVLLYTHPRPDAARVSSAHAAGFELAFVPLPGSADLRWANPLHLRGIPADAHEALGLLRARLALSAPRNGGAWAPAPSREERAAARARRARRARLRFVLRPLDALLTAGIVPRPAPAAALRALVRRRSSNYERLRHLARLTVGAVPPLERALRNALLDGTRLPVARSGLELVGHGTAATVFRLTEPPHSPLVLKVYRWTLGHPAQEQAQMVRRHRARYRRLREWFGARVLATHYLVLHGPLLGLPVAGCLQERVERATDLFARADGELLEVLRTRPGAASEFQGFVRQLLAVRALGFFPDLLGPGNLLLVEDGARARIRLLDYGLFDLRCGTAHLPLAAIEEATRRCARLARELGGADSPS